MTSASWTISHIRMMIGARCAGNDQSWPDATGPGCVTGKNLFYFSLFYKIVIGEWCNNKKIEPILKLGALQNAFLSFPGALKGDPWGPNIMAVVKENFWQRRQLDNERSTRNRTTVEMIFRILLPSAAHHNWQPCELVKQARDRKKNYSRSLHFIPLFLLLCWSDKHRGETRE